MSHPRDILQELQASPRKSLSQNFLTSPHWAERLASHACENVTADEIWEIGPGLGALTRELERRATVPIRLFEFDRKLALYLRKEFPKLDVIEGDFLQADLPSISPSAKRISVLSNLPYHLSSPILFKLIDEKVRLARLVLTFQKEFAARLIACPGDSDFGGLSVVIQLHFKMESLGVVPPGAFYPAPGVASEALVFEPQTTNENLALVIRVVKAAFAHRRKKVVRNLESAFPSIEWQQTLDRLGHTSNARPQELSKEDYLELARVLAEARGTHVADINA